MSDPAPPAYCSTLCLVLGAVRTAFRCRVQKSASRLLHAGTSSLVCDAQDAERATAALMARSHAPKVFAQRCEELRARGCDQRL